tara:strand:+ start:1028 stop:1198 length:171 start_codon:yes stop_codon:yes gene_type:complete
MKHIPAVQRAKSMMLKEEILKSVEVILKKMHIAILKRQLEEAEGRRMIEETRKLNS